MLDRFFIFYLYLSLPLIYCSIATFEVQNRAEVDSLEYSKITQIPDFNASSVDWLKINLPASNRVQVDPFERHLTELETQEDESSEQYWANHSPQISLLESELEFHSIETQGSNLPPLPEI